VTVDCPTDQWGIREPNPSACDDNYRSSVQHAEAKVPFVYLHHKNDLCRFTPYSFVAKHAKPGQLITVLGGNRWSEVCGKASFHSYSERTAALSEALVTYLNRGEVVPVVKGSDD
jgi:hypothetical protein